jgi:phage terminase small subunit
MFINRKEVGKPGEFEGMTDEELDAQIEELLSRGKAGAGESAQRTGATPLKKGMQKSH